MDERPLGDSSNESCPLEPKTGCTVPPQPNEPSAGSCLQQPEVGNNTQNSTRIGCTAFTFQLRPKKPKPVPEKRPAKSKAQWQSEYREKLKADPNKWAEYCAKQKIHSQGWRKGRPQSKRKERGRLTDCGTKDTDSKKAERLATTIGDKTPARQTRGTAEKVKMTTIKKQEYWREQQRLRRARMTPEERQTMNARERERRRNQKVNEKTVQTDDSIPNSVPSPCGEKSPSKQVKYNALHKVKKALPKNRKTVLYVLKTLIKKSTPTKKKMLTEIFVNEMNSATVPKKARSRKRKDSHVKKLVVKYYETNSVDLPGLRQYSKRLKKQRKILTMPISKLFELFRQEYPTCKVSKRNFFRSRPKHILSMKCQKFIQCLCEICENCRLMLVALKSVGAKFNDLNDALQASLCLPNGNWWMPDCVNRKCLDCGIGEVKKNLLQTCESSSVKYKTWTQVFSEKFKVKRTELVEKTCDVSALITIFSENLKALAKHVFTHRWQSNQFNHLKTNLPYDMALIVVDFAENYTCKHQREVSSVHWSYNQVTLHPIVVYRRCPVCSEPLTSYHVFVSDDLNHDSHFVFFVLQMILKNTTASRFVIFSDNCGIQYKSKLPFHHMSQLASDFVFERCYFGERHGKSECDSCGGMVKSFLSQAVASGQALLRNASEILEFLQCNLSLTNAECSHHERSFHLVSESDIDRDKDSSLFKTLPGTKKIHSMKVMNDEVIATRELSCFCPSCQLSNSTHRENSQFIKDFEFVKWPNAKKAQEVQSIHSEVQIITDDNVISEVNNATFDITSEVQNIHDSVTSNVQIITDDNVISEVNNATFDVTSKVQNIHNDSVTSDVQIFTDDNVISEVNNATFDVTSEVQNIHNDSVTSDVQIITDDHVISEVNNATFDLDKAFCHSPDRSTVKESDTEVTNKSQKSQVKRCLLFNEPTLQDREGFFQSMYSKLSKCDSFTELQDTCTTLLPQVQSFSLTIKDQCFNDIRTEVDKVALQLLPPNKPTGYLPALTVGDGNCMTRSLSRLAFGHDRNHLEIRCRIVSELALNEEMYLDENYLSVGCRIKSHKVLGHFAMFSDCHEGENVKDPEIVKSIFRKETLQASRLKVYLGMWQLLAAANVFDCAIISLYPEKGPRKCQDFCGRGLIPKNLTYHDPVYVMWSSRRPDMTSDHWVANHVVPLLKFHKTSI